MKILLIDDHALFRDGVALLLAELPVQPTVLEAGECASGCELLNAHPDIGLILLDLELPGIDGVAGLQRIRHEHPDIPVIVVSAHESVSNVTAVMDAGAMGFIPKSSTTQVMLAALNLVLAGGVYLPPLVLATVADTAPVAATAQSIGLSARQAMVLEHLLRGNSNKEICRELDLSPSTVKNHVSAVFRALNVSSRTQALVAAARLGIRFPGDDPAME
ncbi:response regulator transcription factor [Alcanivorax sp. JB21]|uniref:response regulator n=1 Tax=Alcanivorax limicola TaxID=2874102 RepID=UPI001CBAADCE|nr:response regulator transcription factor [Alcanivorax limicola]MBZ2188984.1 response regulator transcription factor [Alcanivorax limicola]